MHHQWCKNAPCDRAKSSYEQQEKTTRKKQFLLSTWGGEELMKKFQEYQGIQLMYKQRQAIFGDIQCFLSLYL